MAGNSMEPISFEDAVNILAEAFQGQKAKFIFLGAMAVIAYGHRERLTFDIDAEVVMEDYDLLEGLIERVQREKGIILHLTDNASRWGMIDIPDGYRERAIFYKQVENLNFYILGPVDLILSKLRVGRQQDIDDSRFIFNEKKVTLDEIKKSAEKAIKTSPRSTEISNFKRILKSFADEIANETDRKINF